MWIELHESSRVHPKMLRMARQLEIPWAHCLGHLCALWTWTLTVSPDGDLSSYDAEDIALGCGFDGDPQLFLDALIDRGLVERDECGMRIHDWFDFAGSLKAARRKRASRERSRHGTVTGQSRDRGVTVPEDRPTDRPTRPTDRPSSRARPDQFATSPPRVEDLPPAYLPTDEHEQIAYRLREHHAKLWGHKPVGQIAHDAHFERICKFIDQLGEEGCRHIQIGHRKISKKEKSKFTIWRNAYPQMKDKPSEPDWDIATKYLSEGVPESCQEKGATEIQPHVAAEIDSDNEEAMELAKRAGVDAIRSSADFMKIAAAAAMEAKKNG